jgi:cytochrome c6
MRHILVIVAAIIGVSLFVMTGFADETQKETRGESAFNEYCMACHPGGNNIFNPAKTLHKNVLDANNIKTPGDIIKIMRNPGPQMTAFDKDTIPDNVAKEIAEYILQNLK